MPKGNEHNCIDSTKISSDIENFGVSIIMIEETDYLPSFAYSIGLWEKFKHPELICFGLSIETLHTLVNEVASLVKEGQSIQIDEIYDEIFQDSSARFIKVDNRNLSDYFGTAINYYDSDSFSAIQLVWTDRNDKFPWEEDFQEEFIYKQPLLDRNADFKFLESKKLAVFTTRQWLELDGAILTVIHDFEGDWQFLTGDQMAEDIKMVCLKDVILRDNTLNDVFDLEYGEVAEREYVGGKWNRYMMEENN